MSDSQPSILVVDDELMNIQILVRNLQKEDYRISVAMNGEEAWALMEKSPQDFDAVLWTGSCPV